MSIIQNAVGQNIAQNGSMSVLKNCPITSDQLYLLSFWHNPSESSPDVFTMCTMNPSISIPFNIVGTQTAFIDSNYIHLLIENQNNSAYYEYASNELSVPLVKDNMYELTYRISLGDYSAYGMDRIGVLFTVNKPFYPTSSRINEVPQLCTPKGYVLADTANWIEVRDTLVASGGEKYLTIGQFSPNDSLQFTYLPNPINQWASYYIDGVELYELPEEIDTRQPILPNVFTPNNDGVNDTYTISNLPNASKLEVFNRWGGLVLKEEPYVNNWLGFTTNGSELSQGVYMVVLSWLNAKGEPVKKVQTVHLFR